VDEGNVDGRDRECLLAVPHADRGHGEQPPEELLAGHAGGGRQGGAGEGRRPGRAGEGGDAERRLAGVGTGTGGG
jgi:hypothetical protein